MKLHFDLTTLAFQGDITRVGSLMYARDVSLRSYPESGITTANHPSSHHGEDPKRREDWAKINQYHMKCFAHFLKKLESTPDGDGNLLDHSMIVYGSSLADANAHTHHDLPICLVGGGVGQIKGGRHIRYPKDTPLNNLYLNLLDRAGVPVDNFGDSTGKLAYLSDV